MELTLLKTKEIGIDSGIDKKGIGMEFGIDKKELTPTLLTSATAICLEKIQGQTSTQVMDMIEACHTCVGYVFFEIFLFGNPGCCRILYQEFWLIQMDLRHDLELSIGNYFKKILAEVLSK